MSGSPLSPIILKWVPDSVRLMIDIKESLGSLSALCIESGRRRSLFDDA